MITIYLYYYCWNVYYHCASVLWFLPILMLRAYMWWYFHPAYICINNVFVPVGSGHYKASPAISLLSRLYNFRLSGFLTTPETQPECWTLTKASRPSTTNWRLCSCNLLFRYITRGSHPCFFEATPDPHSSNARLNAQMRGPCFCSKTRDPRPCRRRTRGSDPRFSKVT